MPRTLRTVVLSTLVGTAMVSACSDHATSPSAVASSTVSTKPSRGGGSTGSANPRTTLIVNGGGLVTDGASAYADGQCGVVSQLQLSTENRDATTDVDAGWRKLSRSARQACGNTTRKLWATLPDGTLEEIYYVNVRGLGWHPNADATSPERPLGSVGLMTRGICGVIYFGVDTAGVTGLTISESTDATTGKRTWHVASAAGDTPDGPQAYCRNTASLLPLALDITMREN